LKDRDTFWLNEVTLTPTVDVLTKLVKVLLLARWIWKLVSLFELSVQVSVTLSLDVLPVILTAAPARLLGAAGAFKLTVTVFDGADEPEAFTAVT
jgi:hypothetical protein